MAGKILNQQSLKEMKTWNNDKKPDYGLGLMADKSFPYHILMGHSGRGIGTTTDLYYFPEQDRTVAIFCNNGIRAAAPGFKKAYFKMRNFDYIPQLNISETDCMCYLNLISDVFNGIMHSINERTSTRKILEKLITDIYNDGAMRSIGFVRKLIFLYINKYEGVKKKGVKKEK